jgi:hypothetical protein
MAYRPNLQPGVMQYDVKSSQSPQAIDEILAWGCTRRLGIRGSVHEIHLARCTAIAVFGNENVTSSDPLPMCARLRLAFVEGPVLGRLAMRFESSGPGSIIGT